MVKYVDYNYYKEEYKGTMPETSFDRIVVACSSYLKKITFGRIKEDAVPEEVKYACCAMCDAMDEIDSGKVNGRSVKSENNDGYSVTFVTEADGQSSDAFMRKTLYDKARMYLDDTGLLNMRCDYDNEC